MKNRSTIKDGKLVIDTELVGIKKLYKSIDNNFDRNNNNNNYTDHINLSIHMMKQNIE